MYLIFAFLFGLSRAEVGPSAESLYRELSHAPPRGQSDRAGEARDFTARLESFLRLRSWSAPHLELGPLVPVMARFAETGPELGEIFSTLSHPDSGLTAPEVAAVMMSGHFTDHPTARLSPARALLRTLGPDALEAAEVEKREFEIFARLADHAADFAEWDELAVAVQTWTKLAALTSDALISARLDTLKAWEPSETEWSKVLAHYRPSFIDDHECRAIVASFKTTHGLLRAIARVPEPQVRFCLQAAAVRAEVRPSAGLVRTLLRPLGRRPTLLYEAALTRLEAEALDRTKPPRCAHLLAVAINDDPRLPGRDRAAGPALRVIEGGLKSSP
jgi:hypothetical protein